MTRLRPPDSNLPAPGRGVSRRALHVPLRLAVACFAAGCARAAQDPAPARLDGPVTTAPDSLVAFDGRRVPAERGTLSVEHRTGRSGLDTATLDVVWLRLPATTSSPGSPIVFLMGGPGVPGTVMGRIPPYFALFDRLRTVADVILLDQRGTGRSRPGLECPPADPPAADFLATLERLADALVATYAPCVAAWRERGIPAELFGVGEVAADVDAIRRHLNTDRVSLLGFSYGTRLALEYALLYPNRTDRAVLQGVLGPEHGARLPTTLDALLARVDSATPDDVRAGLARRLESLEHDPMRVPVANTTGDSVLLTVGREGLEALVSQAIADPRLPALLHTLDQGDTRLLAVMIGGIYRDLAEGGGSLFGRAVYCSAPPTEARLAEARLLAAGTLLGEIFDNVPVSPAFCDAIGIRPGAAGSASRQGGYGGTALMVEGTLDDRTPVGNAAAVAASFDEAAIVTVVNGGHELLPATEIQDLVVTFLRGEAVTSRTLDWPRPSFLTVEEALRPPRRPEPR